MKKVIISRLLSYCDPFSNIGIFPVSSCDKSFRNQISRTLSNISSYLKIEDSFVELNNRIYPNYQYGRIKYFMELLCQDHSLDPISIEQQIFYFSSRCTSFGHPMINDGNHRLIALLLMNNKYVHADICGTKNMIDYLTGKVGRVAFEKNLN